MLLPHFLDFNVVAPLIKPHYNLANMELTELQVKIGGSCFTLVKLTEV